MRRAREACTGPQSTAHRGFTLFSRTHSLWSSQGPSFCVPRTPNRPTDRRTKRPPRPSRLSRLTTTQFSFVSYTKPSGLSQISTSSIDFLSSKLCLIPLYSFLT